MNQKTAKKLINKTRDDYNLIAHHFASTRKYNWPDIKAATKDFDISDKKVLDLGCGNGRLYEFITKQGAEYTGLDISENLINIAKNKYPKGKFLIGDLLNLPLEDNKFDYIYCVATLHHIPGRKQREMALSEIYRVLKPGGKLFLTTWYFWNKPRYLKQILLSPIKMNKLPFGDFYMPWKSIHKNTLTERYFHAWKIVETKKLLKKYNFIQIIIHDYKHNWLKTGNNLITIAQKPK